MMFGVYPYIERVSEVNGEFERLGNDFMVFESGATDRRYSCSQRKPQLTNRNASLSVVSSFVWLCRVHLRTRSAAIR